MGLKKDIFQHLINSFGAKTGKKIVVFESDDWGGLRMPDADAYGTLLKRGIAVDKCPYSRFDSLETQHDYKALFEVLRSFRDATGRHPVFTLNFNTANPDFDKIRADGFNTYHYEPFTETYRRTDPGAAEQLDHGFETGLLFPQYHGREHINIFMWLDLLKTNKHIREAFDARCYALSFANSSSISLPYLAAFAPYKNIALSVYADIIESGIGIFNERFRFIPQSFVPPVYMYEKPLEALIARSGIKAIQGLFVHKDPRTGAREYRILKPVSKYNMKQLVRNCFFEPSTAHKDWVTECLSEIAIAFKHKRPAIICTHRLNFMGSLSRENREKNLERLGDLLREITRRWETVEFMNSQQLSQLIID